MNAFARTLALCLIGSVACLPSYSQADGQGLPRAPAATDPAVFPPPSPALARRVTGLIEQLRRGAQGGDEREQALEEIVAIGSPAIPLLLSELERRSRDTWPEMIYLLGATGDERVIGILRKEAQRQSGKPLMDALYALSLAGDPTALLIALRSPHATISFEPGVGGTALDFIAGVQGPRAAAVLREQIPFRSREARAAALSTLATLGCESSLEFLSQWAKQEDPLDRRAALIAIGRLGDVRARATVQNALNDTDPDVRLAALEAAGWLRDPAVIPLLTPMVRQRQPSLAKANAVWSLGLIGGPVAAQALSDALQLALDPERARVIQALGNTRDKVAVAPLQREALSAHPLWSSIATEALLKLPDAIARDAVLAVCGEASEHDPGMAAARALVERRDPRAVPCILRRLRDEIAAHQGVSPDVDDLLSRLPLFAPASAAQSLDTVAGEMSAPTIQHRLHAAADAIRLLAERGNEIGPWIELLGSGTPLEVDLAVRRLGELADARAVEPLTRLFGRIEPERSWIIPEALGRIGSERATLFLTQLLTDEIYQVPSLARARTEAARALARYSKSPVAAQALRTAYVQDRGRNLAALLAYARIKGPPCIKDLVELNALQLARRSTGQASRHERVNWVLRQLRSGSEIPLDVIRDIDE